MDSSACPSMPPSIPRARTGDRWRHWPQADLACRAIESAIEADLPLFVASTACSNFERVLRARHRFDRSQILEPMSGLLGSAALEICDDRARSHRRVAVE